MTSTNFRLRVVDEGREPFEVSGEHWSTLPAGSKLEAVTGTLDGRIIDFQLTTGIDPVSQEPMCYGWFLFEGQPLRFETQGEPISDGVQVEIIREAETGEPENAEYQIAVFSPGGGIYLMTQWMSGRDKAEGIVQEFSGIYGPDALELVERSTGDAGYRFETLHRADIWRA